MRLIMIQLVDSLDFRILMNIKGVTKFVSLFDQSVTKNVTLWRHIDDMQILKGMKIDKTK